jgi:hypothetical protein
MLAALVLGVPGQNLWTQARAVQYMVIITPQARWLQPGLGQFLPTRLCFLASDDQEALLMAQRKIQQHLLPHLPPEADRQLKFTLTRDVPAEYCPLERPAS